MIRLAAVLLVLLLALAASQAWAAPQCAHRLVIVQNLAAKFGEYPKMRGLDAAGQMVEFFANPETGTWSLTFTRADMQMCMISTGIAFEAVEPPPPGIPG